MRARREKARKPSTLWGALLIVVSVLMPLVGPARAATLSPDLRLIVATDELTIERAKGSPVYIDLGIYVAATGSPFEIRAGRPDYATPVQAEQILATTTGGTETRALPADVLDGWLGLDDFFTLRLTNDAGEIVVDDMPTFCPNSYDQQRLTDEGAPNPTYPQQCSGNPFALGTVWGIDEGWGSSLTGDLSYRMPSGHYTATVSVTDRYRDLFGIDPDDATATVSVEVRAYASECKKGCGSAHHGDSRRSLSAAIPVDGSPAPSTLPDLIPLPAWNFSVTQERKKTRLSFGATVWASGNASLVVEGFRRADEDLMDAYQYFYKDGVAVGKDQVGSLEFDTRDGHNHWHFKQFARYSLLNAEMNEVMLSKKESFCLASTDAMDLLIPGAAWNPGNQDLHSACGTADALWIRETLPLGWGDTYYQSLPGQSFNITGLPNGTYHVLVEANPEGVLHEVNEDNNSELREIQIKGRPGNRRVIVPPWNGIDTETHSDPPEAPKGE